MIHTVKDFGIVNEAEIDVFLELSCFFHDPVDVGYLISGASAFSKAILNIWTLLGHVLLKLGLENLSISLLAKGGTNCESTTEVYSAAAAKSLQSCPTLCDPIDGSPPGSPVPGIFQARTPEWVAISFSNA